jgi:hypothetical protein
MIADIEYEKEVFTPESDSYNNELTSPSKWKLLPVSVEDILRNPILTLIFLPFIPFVVLVEMLPNLQGLQLPFTSPTPRYQYQNIEEIEWEDWRGRKRRIVIHRRVE